MSVGSTGGTMAVTVIYVIVKVIQLVMATVVNDIAVDMLLGL